MHAQRRDRDEVRTRFLNTEGFRVSRFAKGDAMNNLNGMLAVIAVELDRTKEKGSAA